MKDGRNLEAVCHAIGGLLEALARGRCCGAISHDDFVAAVLQVERDHVRPDGFTLSVSDTADGWVVFSVRMPDCGDTCAAFEFLPESGVFRAAHAGGGPQDRVSGSEEERLLSVTEELVEGGIARDSDHAAS